MPHKLTIALDYDGVLNSYLQRRAWDEQHILEDHTDYPLPGARTWVQALLPHFDLVIFTCRAREPGGKAAVEAWLARWGFPPLPVTGEKPVATLYVDDNALRYTGGPYPSVDAIRAQQSWIHTYRAQQAQECRDDARPDVA